jgi:hypothetical protein
VGEGPALVPEGRPNAGTYQPMARHADGQLGAGPREEGSQKEGWPKGREYL